MKTGATGNSTGGWNTTSNSGSTTR
jgi:hypothetical protein